MVLHCEVGRLVHDMLENRRLLFSRVYFFYRRTQTVFYNKLQSIILCNYGEKAENANTVRNDQKRRYDEHREISKWILYYI